MIKTPKITLARHKKQPIGFVLTAGLQALASDIVEKAEKGISYSITQKHGYGKTTFALYLMEQLRKAGNEVRFINGTSSVSQFLGAAIGVTDPIERHVQRYDNFLLSHPQFVFVDESHHIKTPLFPKVKKYIDSGSVFVLFGQSGIEEKMLDSGNKDVLERFDRKDLPVITSEDIKAHAPIFDIEAIKGITSEFATKDGEMLIRPLFRYLNDCLSYVEKHYPGEKSENFITSELAMKICGDA